MSLFGLFKDSPVSIGDERNWKSKKESHMRWEWSSDNTERFNPLDSGTSDRSEISVLQSIDAIRAFVTGETGAHRMSNQEFADLLRVAASAAERAD